MIDVATYETGIRDEDSAYIELKRKVAGERRRLGLDDPIPHSDLWH